MKQLSLSTGAVHRVILTYQQHGCDVTTAVGSSAWFCWLERATSFTFRGEEGHFTAHKTQAGNRRGSSYWRATRRRHGRLYSFYLGQSAKLTLERLRTAARDLAVRTDDAAPIQLTPPVFPSSASRGFVTGADPLLVTKLHSPRLPMQHVSRPRLLALLEQSTLRSVTLVSAPAGFGKTTLLAEWATTTIFPVAWLSCDSAENDPARFLSSFMAALASLDERLGTTAQTSRSWHTPDHERVLTGLLNDLERLLQQDTVVILDDAHLLATDTVQATLNFLLDHLPTRLHLVIGTRVDPPWPLARLRARGQLSELRTEDLRFVSAEVEAFVSAMGLALSGEAKDLLELRTEGWIAGIQLLALALRGKIEAVAFLRTSGGNHRFLLDYLSEEVLAQQTPEMRRFLLRTCILERMTRSLCDAVTDQPDGQAKLSALLRANLFVSELDDTQTWYRYHPLFAEALRAQLQELEPTLVSELHRRASFWHEQHQDVEAACEYSFLAGDLSRAAALLSDLAPHLIEQGNMLRLSQWLSRLPPALVAVFASLSVNSIWMLGTDRTTSGITEKLIEHLEQRLQTHPLDDPASRADLQQGLTMMQAWAALAQGDLPRTISLAREALCLFSGQDTAWSRLIALRQRLILAAAYRASGDLNATQQLLLEASPPGETRTDPLSLLAASSLAALYEAQGQLRKLGQLSEDVLQTLQGCSDLSLLFLALAQAHSAMLLYEWNRLREAETRAQQAMELAGRLDLSRSFFLLELGQRLALPILLFPVLSLWVQARVVRAGGNDEQAWRLLTPEEFPVATFPFHEQEKRVMETLAARQALACGQFELALRWEAPCGLRPDAPLIQALSSSSYLEYVTLARILIARGRRERSGAALSQALLLLDHLRDLVMRTGFHGWFMEIHMLTALALQAQGKIKQALTTLGAVLAQAEPEGYVRLFADEGQPMAHLLARVAPYTSASSSYLQRCLSAVPPTQDTPSDLPPAARRQQLLEPLSPREREILHLLAVGASNQQIAQQLVISPQTVKLHVKHILAKLTATNRTQAVARARELHLL